MKRVEITKYALGICHMQVCAEKDATDIAYARELVRRCQP